MTSPPLGTDPREHVRRSLADVEALAKSGLPPETFFPQLLLLLAAATGAPGGLVWGRNPKGELSPLCDFGGVLAALKQRPTWLQSHIGWLQELFATGESRRIPPGVGGNDAQSPCLLFAVVQDEKQPLAVVELFIRPEIAAEASQGLLLFLEHACASASQAFSRKAAAAIGATGPRGEFEQFLWLLWQNATLDDRSSVAASDGRVLLGADRVTVVVQRGAKRIAQAVSGQKTVNPRANMTQALLKLAGQAMGTGEPIFFRGETTGLPPTVETLLAEFVSESAARELAVIPLFAPDRPGDPQDAEQAERPSETRRTPIGALVVETLAEGSFRAQPSEKLGMLADHVGAALAQSLSREQILLLPLLTRLGRLREWFVGRRLALAGAILAAVVALLLVLAFVPWEYNVEAQGRVMPAIQQRVFAPWDGEIVEISVHAGDRVSEGQVLLTLRNDELQEKLLTATNLRIEKLRLVASLQARIREAVRSADKNEENRLQGQLEETRVAIVGLDEQIDLLGKRLAQLEVKSPLAGVVATFQVEQLLLHRPVKRGDVLVEVMDETGPWRLEVQVPEHRMFHVLRACEKRGSIDLPVEFVTATLPERTFSGTLSELATRAATDQESRVVEAFVDIEGSQLPVRRIGAEARARIACGPRSLGYVLFGDVVEYLQRQFWWW